MECYYVELVRMKIGTWKMECVEEEARLFSTMGAAQAWFQNNGFVYGQRSFFNYPEGGKEWFHKDDIHLEYIDVTITEFHVDDMTESKFKDLGRLHREWLPEFFKEITDDEA